MSSVRLVISALLSLSTIASFADTVVAVKNGSWENPETWSCGCIPKRTDSIIIPQGIMVSVNQSITLGPSESGEVLGITVAGTLNITSGSLYLDPMDRIVVLPLGKVNSKSNGGTIFSGAYGQYLEGGTLVRGPVTLGGGFSSSTISDVSAVKGTTGLILSWTSGTEIEVNYYNVLRSNDGVNFELIGKVDGRGSRKQRRYSFTDEGNPTGVVHYRIDLTSTNGVGATAANVDVSVADGQAAEPIFSDEAPRHR